MHRACVIGYLMKLTLFIAVWTLSSCAEVVSNEELSADKSSGRSCQQRYQPRGSKVANLDKITYTAARNCTGGTQPGAAELGSFIRICSLH